jgi:WD40 repeat protein
MLSGGTDSVDAIDFDPSGPALAAGDAGGGLYLWDARTGAPLAPSPTLGEQEIVSLHFDPSGRVLEAGLTGGRVVVLSRALWDPVAAIHYLCARLDRGLRAQELAVYHVPGSAASKICS